MPFLTLQAPWFAFLVHPRSAEDACRSGPGAFLRAYSSDEEQFRARLRSIPPLVLGEVRFGFDPIHGELVSVARLPEELNGADGLRAVTEAAEVALQRGARVIGLGALTSPATGGGLTLAARMPKGSVLTNGNAYTAAVVRANVREASEALGLGRQARVAVVGCTGSVGAPASHLLAEDGFRLLLVGRSVQRASKLLSGLPGRVRFEGLDALREADIVVLLTSDPSATLRADGLRPGAVVIDCAQPANVAPERRSEFQLHGVQVIEGGIVRIPNYSCSHDFGLGGPGDTFACLAETYLFAREGLREHSVGRPAPELARRLERIAHRHGISPRPLKPNFSSFQSGSDPLGSNIDKEVAPCQRLATEPATPARI